MFTRFIVVCLLASITSAAITFVFLKNEQDQQQAITKRQKFLIKSITTIANNQEKILSISNELQMIYFNIMLMKNESITKERNIIEAKQAYNRCVTATIKLVGIEHEL